MFLLVCTYSLVQVYDGDIGHHLKSGEWMLGYGRILDKDIFSFTAYEKPWLNHSWLAEIILYCIYLGSGINGLIFFKMLVLVFCYLVLFHASRLLVQKDSTGSEITISALFIMSVLVASPRFIVRPLIFTFLGISLCMYLFVKGRKNINYLFFMPLVFIFWVNLHAEFILGVIMISIFWIYTMLKEGRKKKASLITGLCLLALFFTPSGIRLFTHPVSLTRSDLFMTRISEWLPPMHPVFRQEVFVKIFYLFSGIGLISFILNFKKKNTLFFLFFLIFAVMSFSSIRFMPYFAMMGVPVISENLEHLRKKAAARIRRLRPALACKWQWPARVALAAIVISCVFLIKGRTDYTEFGLGLAEKVCYPLGAGRFLDNTKINGNVFNMCDFGGYLIWFHPERPVFVDGRLDVYGEKLYKDFLDPMDETFKNYNIDYIFLSFRHPATQTLLYNNENWPLIYWDDISLIYLKNNEKNRKAIEKYSYKYISPLTGSYDFLKTASQVKKNEVWKEIHRAIRLSPESIRAHVVLGDLYVELEDFNSAIKAYEDAITLGEKYTTAYMVKIYHNLGKLYHNSGQYQQAETYYKKVLKMARKSESAYRQALEDYGQLVYAEGNKKKALNLIKEAVKYKQKSKNSLLTSYPTCLAKLALLYEEFGKKDKAILAWEEVYETGFGDCREQAAEHLKKLHG